MVVKTTADQAVAENADLKKENQKLLSENRKLINDNTALRRELTGPLSEHNIKEVGVDEYCLKLIVGHRIGDVTEKVYTHRTIENLRREIEKIS